MVLIVIGRLCETGINFVVFEGPWPQPPSSRGMESVSSLCTVGQWTFHLWLYPSCLLTSFYFLFSKLWSRLEFLELMSQMSEFLGSSCVLKVQVKSQGQRFFMEHADQGLRGGRDQFWLCIVHNAKFSGCDGHCCYHVMSSFTILS